MVDAIINSDSDLEEITESSSYNSSNLKNGSAGHDDVDYKQIITRSNYKKASQSQSHERDRDGVYVVNNNNSQNNNNLGRGVEFGLLNNSNNMGKMNKKNGKCKRDNNNTSKQNKNYNLKKSKEYSKTVSTSSHNSLENDNDINIK